MSKKQLGAQLISYETAFYVLSDSADLFEISFVRPLMSFVGSLIPFVGSLMAFIRSLVTFVG
ncbi:hypothetical protein D1814_04890 [Alteromonas sp. BL110]|nr:hypothetical protein D1814_04890 [Alteromonas sp. BL110]RKM80795.1 hypothetical protein D7031_18235 [Alteromonas sp. BL110]